MRLPPAVALIPLLSNHLVSAGLVVRDEIPAAYSDPVPSQPGVGAVACEVAVCSDIGADVLQNGGNAADAVVATNLCVGVIAMYHSGLGGGGFLIVRGKDGAKEVVNFRETAPAAAFEDMFTENANLSLYSGLASGVPGELRGLEYLHKNYGSLPWADLVAPSIKLAHDGFVVTQDLINYIASATDGIENFLVENPSWAIDFAPTGRLIQVNETMTRRRYAATLQTIADYGVDAFYSGPIAETTIKAIQANNGTMTLDDLANYTVSVEKAINVTYRDTTIFSSGPPSSGAVSLSTLGTIEGYDMSVADGLTTHRFDEALRFAYGQRVYLADPAFTSGLDEYVAQMLTNGSEIRSRIQDDRTLNVSDYDPAGFESKETPGTSAIVVVDAEGIAVSTTSTINLLFGSHIIVPETGVILNNQMNDFSIPGATNSFGYIPSPANYVAPGKRPLSSIANLFAEYDNGDFFFASAANGGSRIITVNTANVWRIIDQELDLETTLANPRLHDQLVPNTAVLETGYDETIAVALELRGHNVTRNAKAQSGSHVVLRNRDGSFAAAAEPRLKASGSRAL